MSARDMTKWLAERRTYLGASEIAAVCGLSSYETPHSVWLKKTGQVEEEEDTLPMRRGRHMEAFVARLYAESQGRDVKTLRPAWTKRMKGMDFIAATPDRLIVEDGRAGVLECKDVGQFQAHKFGETGSDEVSDEYLIQVAVQMAVWDRPFGRLAAFVNGREFRWYHFEADSPLIEAITERAVEQACAFWRDHVLTGVPPQLTGHGPDVAFSRSHECDGTVIDADEDLDRLCGELLAQTEKAQAEELAAKALQARIADRMGGAAVLRTRFGDFTHKPDCNGVKRFLKPKGRNAA